VTAAHSEDARQWIHTGSGCFALLLRYLTWPQAAGFALLALVFNAVVLPRIGGARLYRPEDRARGFPLGILLYPIAVLALILTFPSRLDIAAACWGILAFGDGAATLVGRHARIAPLPWNPQKSAGGTIAFVVCGALAGTGLAWWTRSSITPEPALLFTIAAPAIAAVIAAFVETIPITLDDNISVPVSAAGVMWIASLASESAWGASRATVISSLAWAIGVNAVVSWLGYRAKTVTIAGMLGGAAVGIVIFTCGGASAWTMLFATFVVASVTSRLGLARKAALGIAEERGGRRGAGNAFANCGVSVVATIAAVITPFHADAMLAFVAALAAGGSDTVASEIGKAWGQRTYLITSFGRVAPGTPGAMSLEGTSAGIVAAAGLAAIGAGLGLIPHTALAVVIIAATAGAIVESVLGATIERAGILNNDMLNFINTAVAAAVALALA